MISHITTLANGIIGVSVLAMPFCFKQCGIILATVVLLLSSALSRLACHFLIKSAVMCRRKNFEFLAFHAFGPMGKFLAELCIIGFLVGTCIAYFVVVGDLGPQIIGEFLNKNPEDIRTTLLVVTAIFIVLPLGLLRNVSSLASISTASVAFYICLVLKVVGDSTHHIFAADWFDNVYFWRPAGILQCLPIFALALFCQTQLFEIYEAMPNATLEKMNEVVRGALNICTIVYVSVGCFGYIGFCTQQFSGNILMSFEPSATSEIIKIGFVLSVAFSFPLVIFPCRASLNSLLFRQGYTHLETSTSYISETRFRCLTIFIVIISLIVGISIPNIEFVLGIIGSTIGVLICLIFPATFFISISTKNTNERLLAQILVIIGIMIMVLGTYANLYAMEQSSNSRTIPTTPKLPSQVINDVHDALVDNNIFAEQSQLKQPDNLLQEKDIVEKIKPMVPDKPSENENKRQEPPVPVDTEKKNSKIIEPIGTISSKVQEIVDKINKDKQLIDRAKIVETLKKNKETNDESLKSKENLVPNKLEKKPLKLIKESKNVTAQKNDVIAPEAIKNEERELAADKELSNVDPLQRREQLEKTLEKHIMQQEQMILEQKILLEDIKQKEKELQKKYVDVNNENIPQKENVNSPPLEDKSKHFIPENKGPQLNLSNESIKINKISNNNNINNNDNSKQERENKEANKLDNLDNSKKLNQESANLFKKSEDPIIQALTKKSNKISDIQETNINKNGQNNDKKLLENKSDYQPDSKKIEYSIPFVMKVNQQNNQNSDSLQINQSKVDIVPVQREILENHQREKRMIDEEQFNDLKTSVNRTVVEKKNNSVIENDVMEKKETCSKNEKDLQITNNMKNVKFNEVVDDESVNDLIQTSAHLSQQETDILKTVSINPGLPSVDLKIQSRDLKSLGFENLKKK